LSAGEWDRDVGIRQIARGKESIRKEYDGSEEVSHHSEYSTLFRELIIELNLWQGSFSINGSRTTSPRKGSAMRS
ncbi:hypothetical protein, partial [Methanomethylophilus alvi]|uniref:hypothetical protein n=1 Tax=Methanomethylophilus alvi TaxID=1291540 RepID=UPI0037DCB4F4